MWGVVTNLMQRIPGAPVLGQPHAGVEPVTVLFQILGGNPRLLIWAIIALGNSSLLARPTSRCNGQSCNFSCCRCTSFFLTMCWLKSLALQTTYRPPQVRNWLGAGKQASNGAEASCNISCHSTVVATHAPFGFKLPCLHAACTYLGAIAEFWRK